MQIQIRNFKNLACVDWLIPSPGWHVVIGDSGSGKSALLQALECALTEAPRSRGPSPARLWTLRSYIRAEQDAASVLIHRGGTQISLQIPRLSEVVSSNTDQQNIAWYRYPAAPEATQDGLDEWLRTLQSQEKPEHIDLILGFLAQEGSLAPRFHENVQGGYFIDRHGSALPYQNLSSGDQRLFQFAWSLLASTPPSHKASFQVKEDGSITCLNDGIVLLDDAEHFLSAAQLSPLGAWLQRLFPNITFIVATRSPFICHGASSIFHVSPSDTESGSLLEGVGLDRLLYGNVLEAYSTGAFGAAQRAPEAQEMLYRLATLNVKARTTDLDESEEQERDRLASIFTVSRSAIQAT